MVLPSAANRDPREFEQPDELRLDRENARQHIAFGHGIHTCAGAPLARAETNVSLQRLLDRMADIRISEPTTARPATATGSTRPPGCSAGHDRLHLEFTPIGLIAGDCPTSHAPQSKNRGSRDQVRRPSI